MAKSKPTVIFSSYPIANVPGKRYMTYGEETIGRDGQPSVPKRQDVACISLAERKLVEKEFLHIGWHISSYFDVGDAQDGTPPVLKYGISASKQ